MKESGYLPPDRHTCFLETTREIEGDDDRERLEAKLGNVAKGFRLKRLVTMLHERRLELRRAQVT
jgi:hypothetical protein